MSVIFDASQIIKHKKLSDDIRLYRTNNVEGGRKQEELADEQWKYILSLVQIRVMFVLDHM